MQLRARGRASLIVAARGDPARAGLIDAPAVIDALGPEGLLINVARGFVVDQPALIAALKSGRLGGAALDVFDPEPAGAAEWAKVPNVLLSPHMGVGDAGGGTAGWSSRRSATCAATTPAQPLRSRVVWSGLRARPPRGLRQPATARSCQKR